MTGNWKYWCVCTGIILVVMMTSIPVSAAGSGKLTVPGVSFAQHWGGSIVDKFSHVNATRDGGYIVIGTTTSNDYDLGGVTVYGGNDIWVMKFSSTGTPEWRRCYGGTGDDYGTWIEQTADGGYIFTSLTSSNDGNINPGEYHNNGDVWVVKTDSYGYITWQHCFGGSNTDWGHSITQTGDKGYILTGGTTSNDFDMAGNHGMLDVFLMKLSVTGSLQWKKCYGGTGDDSAYTIQKTNDGGYIVSGFTHSTDGDVVGLHSGSMDIWVVKYSEDGMIQWQRCLGGSAADYMVTYGPVSIQKTNDGGYILVGTTLSNDGDVSGMHNPGTGHSDVWVAKLSESGAIQWQKCLGGSGDDYGSSIQPTSDGGYILTGYAVSTDGDVNGHYGSIANEDGWVVKLDSSGRPLWQRCIGGSKQDEGFCIQQVHDGGYIIVGQTTSIDGDIGGNYGTFGVADAMTVKMYGPPTLASIAPTRNTGVASPIQVVLSGANLMASSTVIFSTTDWPDVYGTVLSVSPDGSTITATVDISTMIPGMYTILIINPDGQYTTLPNAFTRVCGAAPTVSSISTTSALQGQALYTQVIRGTNFYTGAIPPAFVTAILNRTGQPEIRGSNYVYISATQFTCDFQIPAGAAPGKWNLVVTNPDGRYGMKKDAFTVNVRTFKPPRVSSVTPRSVTAGSTVYINGIAGSFFNASATVAMTGPRSVSIPVSNVTVLSDTKITCDANLTSVGRGYATVTVTNPDGKKSTRARAFSIK